MDADAGWLLLLAVVVPVLLAMMSGRSGHGR